MTEWPLVLIAGFLGSSHCIGMCGPLALAIGSTMDPLATNLRRQLIFSGGRIFTYSFLGAMGGYLGLWLGQQGFRIVNVPAALAVVAGVFLIVLGLISAGVVPRWPTGRVVRWCAGVTWLATFLKARGWVNVFLAGLFTGFIPCGLVYAFLALAVASGSLAHGAFTMLLFGIGTVPLMLLAGCGGSLLSVALRSKVLKVAAWCVVVTGLVSVARGAGYLELPGTTPGGCPACIAETATGDAAVPVAR